MVEDGEHLYLLWVPTVIYDSWLKMFLRKIEMFVGFNIHGVTQIYKLIGRERRFDPRIFFSFDPFKKR